MTLPVKLCVLSSQTIFRECLRQALCRRDRFEVESRSCGEECLRHLQRGLAELVVVDLTHPVRGLRRLLQQVGRLEPAVKVVLLGIDPAAAAKGVRWVESAADALLPLDASLEETVDAVDRVLAGEKVLPPRIAYVMFQRLAQRSRQRQEIQRSQGLMLTPREQQILGLVADRYSNAEIASELEISVHTVKNHVHNILEKLEVEDRATAAELADENGWLDSSGPTIVDSSGSHDRKARGNGSAGGRPEING